MATTSQKRKFAIMAVWTALLLSAALLALELRGTPVKKGALEPARLAARGERVPLLVECREQPLKVSPNPGLRNTVSEEDMVTVLCSASPFWSPPSVPSAFHELKLWGRNAVFTKKMVGAERTGEFFSDNPPQR
jgi:hypothetical protein